MGDGVSRKIKQVRVGRLGYMAAYTAGQELLNARYSYSKLERPLSANFDDGDLFVTLTYDDDHPPPASRTVRTAVMSWPSRAWCSTGTTTGEMRLPAPSYRRSRPG